MLHFDTQKCYKQLIFCREIIALSVKTTKLSSIECSTSSNGVVYEYILLTTSKTALGTLPEEYFPFTCEG